MPDITILQQAHFLHLSTYKSKSTGSIITVLMHIYFPKDTSNEDQQG